MTQYKSSRHKSVCLLVLIFLELSNGIQKRNLVIYVWIGEERELEELRRFCHIISQWIEITRAPYWVREFVAVDVL